ncbi:hypothetical protein SLEP1_g10866 [Rubroshorea leprosula]|uniref:Uncharacterized protein n=1 Tax=Rubroshorea leprosula TaxID=152421 RepID=A0AAV5IHD9_9ROSI|nr:hypothetical protein SLEP1_g10866 [Rubroshorea leprosula]
MLATLAICTLRPTLPISLGHVISHGAKARRQLPPNGSSCPHPPSTHLPSHSSLVHSRFLTKRSSTQRLFYPKRQEVTIITPLKTALTFFLAQSTSSHLKKPEIAKLLLQLSFTISLPIIFSGKLADSKISRESFSGNGIVRPAPSPCHSISSPPFNCRHCRRSLSSLP